MEKTGHTFMPFAELVKGDHFLLHPKHHFNTDPKTVFIKLNRNLYMAIKSGTRRLIHDHNLCRTWAAVADEQS